MHSILKNRQFVFSWFYLVALVILFSIFCGLSIWQLIRAAEKEQIQAEYELAFNAKEVDIKLIDKLDENIYRTVFINGEYVKEGEILIDNIIVNRKPGYYVMSAFKYQKNGSMRIIYINRGWVPQGKDRADIPNILYPEDQIEIIGKIYNPRSKPVMLGLTEVVDNNEERVYLYFDKKIAKLKLGDKYIIDNEIIRLDAKSSWGYNRYFPGYSSKIAMHYGYFVHWIVFALFTLIIYLYVSFRKIDDNDGDYELHGTK